MSKENDQKLQVIGFLLRDVLKSNTDIDFDTDSAILPLLPDIKDLFEKLVDQGYINSGKTRYSVSIGNISTHINMSLPRKLNEKIDETDVKRHMEILCKNMKARYNFTDITITDFECTFTEDMIPRNTPDEVQSVFSINTDLTITIDIDAFDEIQAKKYAWSKICDGLYDYIDEIIDTDKTYDVKEIPHKNAR